MLPTLWPNDLVEIASCSADDVCPGEIVLALREDRFFLHRLVARSQDDSFLLRGDSLPRPDPQFPNGALLGRLVGRAGQNQRRAHSQGQAQPRPFLPLRPWSRAMGQLLCHWDAARRLILKLHGWRRSDMRKPKNAEGAPQLEAMDVGAS